MARTGRPPFQPTERQRGEVSAMVVCGIPEEQVARKIGITRNTLRKHFRDEIELSRMTIHTEVSTFIVNTILGRGAANRLTNDAARASLAQFYAARQMGWKDTTLHQHEGTKDGPPIKHEHDARSRNWDLIQSIASRMARPAAGGDPPGDNEPDE